MLDLGENRDGEGRGESREPRSEEEWDLRCNLPWRRNARKGFRNVPTMKDLELNFTVKGSLRVEGSQLGVTERHDSVTKFVDYEKTNKGRGNHFQDKLICEKSNKVKDKNRGFCHRLYIIQK